MRGFWLGFAIPLESAVRGFVSGSFRECDGVVSIGGCCGCRGSAGAARLFGAIGRRIRANARTMTRHSLGAGCAGIGSGGHGVDVVRLVFDIAGHFRLRSEDSMGGGRVRRAGERKLLRGGEIQAADCWDRRFRANVGQDSRAKIEEVSRRGSEIAPSARGVYSV